MNTLSDPPMIVDDRTPILPAHIEETVAAIAQVHADHYRRSGPIQRIVGAMTVGLARPSVLMLLTGSIVCWLAVNMILAVHGQTAPDPPPFAYLSTGASIMALLLSSMILITQRHDDELASHRDQLTLELAILNEKKSAKIIELLEAERMNDPTRRHHRDLEAEALAMPADPQAVLEAIKATHAEPRDLEPEAAE